MYLYGILLLIQNSVFPIVFLSTEVLNVLMVNWKNLAESPCYPAAVDFTEFVGQLTGYMIKENLPQKTHIIGFSLGAHIAGVAGQINSGKINRITGKKIYFLFVHIRTNILNSSECLF